jgi:hypothetical protein
MAQNYILLESIILTQTATSITFDNLPSSGYTDLKIMMSVRGSSGNSNYEPIGYRINGTAPNGVYKSSGANGSATVDFGAVNDTFTASTAGGTWSRLSSSGTQPGGTTTSHYSSDEFNLFNYRSSVDKSWSYDTAFENNSTTSYLEMTAGRFTSSTAVTSIAFALRDGSFVAGSTFALYGIAEKNTTPTIAPFATGGNVIAQDGTYWYHAFLSSGTFTPLKAITADILVVAGGGSPGQSGGGGGGAGGLLAHNSQSLIAGNYGVMIGAGGASSTTVGLNGSNSQFGSLTASIGGGGGGSNVGNDKGNDGGSGGGANAVENTPGPGLGTVGQGNNGGNYVSSNSAGGGGGAGEAGNTDGGSQGGDGVSTYSSWGLATTTGHNVSGTVWFAGGGGGGSNNLANTGVGGLGGGGGNAESGFPNTGGGGGSTWTSAIYASGGSGIVIVRYPMVS